MRRRGSFDDPEDDEDDDWDPDESDDEDLTEDDEPTIACPNCRRQIHEDAQRCPYCEHYVSEEDRQDSTQPWWVIVGALLALGAVLSWFAF